MYIQYHPRYILLCHQPDMKAIHQLTRTTRGEVNTANEIALAVWFAD